MTVSEAGDILCVVMIAWSVGLTIYSMVRAQIIARRLKQGILFRRFQARGKP